MTTVKTGDSVQIHYTGTLADGSTFDSSAGRDPLAFVVGSGQIIPGLDIALPGMALGQRKRVEVPFLEAYGPADPEARFAVPRADVPADMPLTPGTAVQVETADGETLELVIIGATEDEVLLDGNHPLAGKDLTFDIELVAIG